jgi:hypothetical protein
MMAQSVEKADSLVTLAFVAGKAWEQTRFLTRLEMQSLLYPPASVMRQKLDFSLLVLTSCIVVLTLEPAHHSLSNRSAATPEASFPKTSDRVEQVEHSEIHRSPSAQIVAGTEERFLRLLERKNDEELGWG